MQGIAQILKGSPANVRWKNDVSESFSVKNGIRQGAILSPRIFCFYMNDLFEDLRESRSGCYTGPYYAGAHGYADDLLLLSPSIAGLQEMVSISEQYAKAHKIQFSTNQDPQKIMTKSMIFSKKELNFEPKKIEPCRNPLPWVTSAKYLGGILTNIPDGYQNDVKCKRAQLIGRNCELLQEFPLVHPQVKCKINSIYNSSFHGSMLWDFMGERTNQLFNSWSVAIRYMWNLPFNSHRYFIEPLGGPHAKTLLICRYFSFIQSGKIDLNPKLSKFHVDDKL